MEEGHEGVEKLLRERKDVGHDCGDETDRTPTGGGSTETAPLKGKRITIRGWEEGRAKRVIEGGESRRWVGKMQEGSNGEEEEDGEY